MSYEIPLFRLELVRERALALEERPVLKDSADVARIVEPLFSSADREVFAAMLLSAKHRIIGLNVVSIGSLTSALVHPAILGNAAAVILCHNHPSGDPAPSPEDREITRRLRSAGDILGIRLLDHVILGDRSFLSFADQRIL